MEESAKFDQFVVAQTPVYDEVKRELTAGRKQSHWMWFIFPQIAGLGSSPYARRFGIASVSEARHYWEHPVLGERLRECTRLALNSPERDADRLFCYPDNLKFRSSMTLFALSAPEDPLFQTALDRFFEGKPDSRTLELAGQDSA